jgi:peptidoglycan/LPS O-acetylase OafA/YrhL
VGDAGGRFYLPQLDGLRFCAFLLVFVHHSPVFPGGSRAAASVKDMGWVGVDLFFVLSAYLLIALLQKEYAATGATDFKKFFIRRALRIWPLFYVYVATCFVHFVATDGEDLTKMTGRTIGHLFFVDNFFSAFSGEYNPLPFTPHLWTIAFEEQIYLFMPLLFMAIVGLRRNNTLFAVTAVAIVVSQPLLRWGLTRFHINEITLWVTPFLHFDTIFAGLLLGAGVGSTLKERVSGDAIAIAGALVLGYIVFVLADSGVSEALPIRGVYLFTLLAIAFFLIVLGCLDPGSRIARLLARQPFVFLGRISYGLYVWHWIGNQFGPGLASSWFSPVMTQQNVVVAWFSVVMPALSLTVALSVLSYFALERPFLRIKSRFTLVPNRAD